MHAVREALILCGLIVFSPLLLTSLFSLFFLFGSVNAFWVVFISRFRVENRTGAPLWITPVGTFNSGVKGVLPQFATSFPAFPAFRSRELRVDPGRSRRIRYDWDNINFSEIVVRNARGEYRQLIVDPDPPKKDYSPNRQEVYVIADFDSLSNVAQDVFAAASEAGKEHRFWLLFVTGFPVLGFYLWLLAAYRNLP
jgi:hypothetical protein